MASSVEVETATSRGREGRRAQDAVEQAQVLGPLQVKEERPRDGDPEAEQHDAREVDGRVGDGRGRKLKESD